MLERIRSIPNLDGITLVVTTILTTYVLAIPTSKNYILFPALALLFAIAVARIVIFRVIIDTRAAKILCLWLAVLVFGVCVAIFRGAESWIRVLVFLGFWPVVFSVCAFAFSTRLIKPIITAGMITSSYIAVHYVLAGLIAQGLLPDFSVELLKIGTPIGLYFTVDPTGNVAATGYSLVELLWWGSLSAASCLWPKSPWLPPHWLRYTSTVLCIIAAIVSWRRAILLTLIAVPLLILLTHWLLRGQKSAPLQFKSVALACASFVVPWLSAAAIGFVLQASLRQMLGGRASIIGSRGAPPASAQNPSLDPPIDGDSTIDSDILDRKAGGDSLRMNEFTSLTYPDSVADGIFGHGLGANFDRNGVDRPIRPWQTELQYNGLFYWLGAIGVVGILLTFVGALRWVRAAALARPELKAPLFVSCVGALGIMVGNATNPYLQAPGIMLSIFLPLGIAAAMHGPSLVETRRVGPVRFGSPQTAAASQ